MPATAKKNAIRPVLDEPPEQLCVLRLSAIGDTCHTVPCVRAIQRAWPRTSITWIIGKVEYGLMRGLEGIDLVDFDKSRGLAAYAQLRRRLRGRHFGLLLHMHASSRANIASLMVRADVRLGFDRSRARDFQYFFCNRHIRPRSNRHVMDGLLEFAEALGIDPGEPEWSIPIDSADRAYAERYVGAQRPTLVISPCTGERFRNYRNWQASRYAEVADYAADRYDAQIVLTGAATTTELEYGRTISERCRNVPCNLIGKTSLKQLLAIIERAKVLLCPDSGPAHMATAVDTPVVGLYATSNRFRTGPYFSQHLVVDRYPDAVRRELGTSVERIRFGRRVRDPNAMDLISVADVVEKLDLAFTEAGVVPA